MSSLVELSQLTRKDYVTDQEVRWCPGCGDYSILANVQRVMPELGIPLENMVWVSGIGCSSRFPYYMNTYGFHTIHGRAPAIAMGIKVANPELSVWIATGDGDGLSIGGNHLLHCLRRNLDVKILLFNNRIYGLTKGQYSPTSEFGKITKSTPSGSADSPVDPASFAIGCGGTFVARSIDTEAAHLGDMLRRAAQHKGTAFTEIYQNCNVFNDGAFDSFTDKDNKSERQLRVEHGKPLVFGANSDKGLRVNPKNLSLEVVQIGKDGVTLDDVMVHDETSATLAYMLARMPFPAYPVAIGVLYAVTKPTYDETLKQQLSVAKEKLGTGDLDKLLHSGNTWQV
jgi:2-oxoglutarate ferredoxin oxidoreductase subunit beta